MLISPKLNLIFVHAPKTGGTSVRHLLRELDPMCVELAPHLRVSDGQRLVFYWSRFYRFSICRHPCETLVSHYCNIIRLPEHGYYGTVVGPDPAKPLMSFGTWMRWFSDTKRGSPVAWFMDGPLDYVVRHERLEEDIGKLMLRLNVKGWKLPRLNEGTNRRPWREYFTPEDLDYARVTFAEDFRRFNYSIDEVPARGTASVAAGEPPAS